jgi:diguanylate cyclase (GGDEF)-like protein
LNAEFATGKNSRLITKHTIGCDEGLAGKALISCKIEVDGALGLDKKALSLESLDGLNSAISVPMNRGDEPFGVLVLYSDVTNGYGDDEIELLEAIGERVAPLLNSSFSFERNISNAMTDSLTNLPNERAFYLVLENQIAEAQRFPEQRALTILAIDIKGFADFNRSFGFSTGDNLLTFASDVIKDQLRKMDFLARSMNDEFWVVLPTASDEITGNIRKRIETAFSAKTFALPDNKRYPVELNFGAATFLKDGDTTNQLLQLAILRKKQNKSKEESTVIMFPREYVN